MEFSELVKLRQSDRKYQHKPVEKEKVLQCIETARLAPSADNSQPWKFVVVDDHDLKEQVADCASGMGLNRFTHQSPVIVAVVMEKMSLPASVASYIKNKEYALMDIGMAVNQFCLQAAELGLGTCIIGWFDEKSVKKILHISRDKRVPLLISLGYSSSPTRKKIRKPIGEISSWNRY